MRLCISSHDRFDCQKEAFERLLTLPANTRDVGDLSAEHEEEFAKDSVKPTIFGKARPLHARIQG